RRLPPARRPVCPRPCPHGPIAGRGRNGGLRPCGGGAVAELRGGGRGHTGPADRQHMEPPGQSRQKAAHRHAAASHSAPGRFLVCLGRLPSSHLHLRRAVTPLEELATRARSAIARSRAGRLDRRPDLHRRPTCCSSTRRIETKESVWKSFTSPTCVSWPQRI